MDTKLPTDKLDLFSWLSSSYMYVLKLPWLNHSEEKRHREVYSLSVSPDGERLASGGLDGKVRIWSIRDLLKFKDKTLKRDETCKPLCSMARHTGAVTVVKFSPDGRFLASGSDDKVLLIWEKDDQLKPTFGEQNTEHWSVTKRVVAHDNDIQDIAWAPDSSILVSVGLDRSIIIWNGTTFERIKRFDVHQSTVKGVVFDPANKYFATASDDRSVRIFRYHKGNELSFSIEKTILKPFKKSPLTTYFRRLSWSPDGQHIAVPNATNGPVTSVAIINRGSWESDISLIGHDTPCEVACFSPVLYEVKVGGSTQITSIVATGGQDKSLVVWNNSFPKPIAVFEEIQYKTITDLSWNPSGNVLFISSLDGTITVIEFEDGELGKPISSAKNEELLNKYGVDKDSMVFPESANQLILEDKAKEHEKSLSGKHLDILMRMEQQLNHKPSAATCESSTPIVSTQIEKKQPTVQEKAILNKVTISNGKKRVAPTLISSSSSTISSRNRFKPVTITVADKIDGDPRRRQIPLSVPSYDLPKFGLHTSINGYYVKKVSDETDNEDDENDEIENFEEAEEEEDLVYKRRKYKNNDSSILMFQSPNTVTRLLSKTVRNESKSQILEILNYEEIEDDEPTTIRCYENGKVIFEQFISEQAISVSGVVDKYWVIATNNSSVIIYSPFGRLLYSKIELGYNVDYMSCQDDYLILLTEDYMIHTYDLKTFKILNRKVSLAPILNSKIAITDEKKILLKYEIYDIELKSSNILVYLSDNQVYMFNNDLKCWNHILDKNDQKYNHYDNIWVDRYNKLKTADYNGSGELKNIESHSGTTDDLKEYVRKLAFHENYDTLLSYLKDENQLVKNTLAELKKDSKHSLVRGE
ncbi:hypothetical protein WICMUC_002955 [Wickerhamomyces mucosus]|uniref:Protein HIR n=1 Tax=Wickerhamomyces mucosus TaxID=1378264 RepID=A0A9P8PNT7_9ASCO|nr:hypothetical protein WICMUC_002955 [Wickerhamomyces mucosus]